MFHFEPEQGIGAKLHWIIHGVHHDHPNDPLRLVMPPSVSIPLASLFVWGFYAGARQPGVLPVLSRFLSGYLFYDMLHYHVHHHRPKTALGRRLRELHMRHHFQDHERGYGVSRPVLGPRVRHRAEAAVAARLSPRSRRPRPGRCTSSGSPHAPARGTGST